MTDLTKKPLIMDRQERIMRQSARRKAEAVRKKKQAKEKTLVDAPQIKQEFAKKDIVIDDVLSKPEKKQVSQNIKQELKKQGADPKQLEKDAKEGKLSSGFVNILAQGLGLLVGGAIGGEAGAVEGFDRTLQLQDIQRKEEAQQIEQERKQAQLELQQQQQADLQDFRERSLQQTADIARLRRQADLAKVQIKDEKERQALAIPMGDKIIHATDKESAKELRKGIESFQNLETELDKAIALRKKHGRELFSTGEDAAQAQQIMTNLKLLLKSKEFAELGVLTGPDLDLLEEQLGGDLQTVFASDEFVIGKLNSVRQSMKDKLDAKIKTRTIEGKSRAKVQAELKRRGLR